jgi:hypothetical protein
MFVCKSKIVQGVIGTDTDTNRSRYRFRLPLVVRYVKRHSPSSSLLCWISDTIMASLLAFLDICIIGLELYIDNYIYTTNPVEALARSRSKQHNSTSQPYTPSTQTPWKTIQTETERTTRTVKTDGNVNNTGFHVPAVRRRDLFYAKLEDQRAASMGQV